MSHPFPPATDDARRPQRIRHELRFRTLQVQHSERINPHLVRITLTGDALPGFTSPGFDDHVKLFFPDPETGVLVLPQVGPAGPVYPEGGARPIARDYTPRHYDPAANTLQIDFALHEAGPATAWALQAKPGDALGVGGPRGSFILPTNFDTFLLIGDDTALPAISRRLAELPAGTNAIVIAEVEDASAEQRFSSAANVNIEWIHRRSAATGETTGLQDALRRTRLPTGDFHAWVACESLTAKALRTQLIQEHGARPQWTKASGYWRRGQSATHEEHED